MDEAACPFCGGAIGTPSTKRGGRMHRGAIMFAVTVAGCSGSSSDDTNVTPAYGVPYDAAMSDTTTTGDTSIKDTSTADAVDASDATDVSDANDAADTEETRFLPPYGAPSDPSYV